eukprot:scaffold7340_cov266-Pinguiococcus_pyrenoidosus.AAC.86
MTRLDKGLSRECIPASLGNYPSEVARVPIHRLPGTWNLQQSSAGRWRQTGTCRAELRLLCLVMVAFSPKFRDARHSTIRWPHVQQAFCDVKGSASPTKPFGTVGSRYCMLRTWQSLKIGGGAPARFWTSRRWTWWSSGTRWSSSFVSRSKGGEGRWLTAAKKRRARRYRRTFFISSPLLLVCLAESCCECSWSGARRKSRRRPA